MDVVYRYIKGSNIGILGKLNQHNDTFISDMKNLPKANEVISSSILEKLDNTKVYPKFRGTMGIIYAGCYLGKKIAIKIIPENTKKVVNDETWLLNTLGICNIVNKSIVDVVKDLELRMKRELRMDIEYDNWSLFEPLNIRQFGCRTVRPIHLLCDSEHFVYEYENHKSISKYISILNDSKKVEIYTRIVSLYLHSQLDKIFIGDPNYGNFLYDTESDEIILIDYGCVMKIDQKFMTCMNILLYNLLYSKTNKYLARTFCNNSMKCKLLLDQIHYILSGVDVDFKDLQLDLFIFDIDAIIGSKFRPETITILRSLSHLLLLARKMEIKLNIRNILLKYAPFDGNISKYRPTDIDSLL